MLNKFIICLISSNQIQGSTNLIFACTDFRAHKMVLRARSCRQIYMYGAR